MDNELKIASNNKNTRLFVIENAIFIEELTSRVLGILLNIDHTQSKSFGSTSGALSFNQKLQLIQDIKGISKEDINKITCVSNIRNKFAHVSTVDTFKYYFNETSVGKDSHKQFLKWYFDNSGISDIPPSKIEISYRLCFYLLVDEVINILLKISDEAIYEKGFQTGKRDFNERFLSQLLNKLKRNNLHVMILEALDEAETSAKVKE